MIINVKGPVIEIESITGGLFKINAIIKNTGDGEAIDVKWNITLYGGSILLGRFSSGTISFIPAGDEVTIVSRFIYGFGFPTVIMVETGISDYPSDIEVKSADIFLFFINTK